MLTIGWICVASVQVLIIFKRFPALFKHNTISVFLSHIKMYERKSPAKCSNLHILIWFSMSMHWYIFVVLFQYLYIFCTKGWSYIIYKKYRPFTKEISHTENYQISTLGFFILYFKEIKNTVAFIPKDWLLFPTKISGMWKQEQTNTLLSSTIRRIF